MTPKIILYSLIVIWWILVGLREGVLTKTMSIVGYRVDDNKYHTVRFLESLSLFMAILLASKIGFSYALLPLMFSAWTVGMLCYEKAHSIFNGQHYWLTPHPFTVFGYVVRFKPEYVYYLFVLAGILLGTHIAMEIYL